MNVFVMYMYIYNISKIKFDFFKRNVILLFQVGKTILYHQSGIICKKEVALNQRFTPKFVFINKTQLKFT